MAEPESTPVEGAGATGTDELWKQYGFNSKEELETAAKNAKEMESYVGTLKSENDSLRRLIGTQSQPRAEGANTEGEYNDESTPPVPNQRATYLAFRHEEKLQEKQLNNPELFSKLEPVMQQILREKPEIRMMSIGVDMLWKEAEKRYQKSLEELKRTVIDDSFIGDLKNKIREEIIQETRTKVSGFTSPGGNPPPTTETKADIQAELDRAKESGDGKKVADLILQKYAKQVEEAQRLK